MNVFKKSSEDHGVTGGMRACWLLITGLVLTLCVGAVASPQNGPSLKTSGRLFPASFVENRGQWPDSVLYRLDLGDAIVWITPTSLHYQFARLLNTAHTMPRRSGKERYGSDPFVSLSEGKPDSVEYLTVSAELVGVNPHASVLATEPSKYRCNFYRGKNHTDTIVGVRAFGRLHFAEAWPGIDLEISARDSTMEYSLHTRPGVDISRAKLRYLGVSPLAAKEPGSIVIPTAWGEIRQQAPSAYQEGDGTRQPVSCKYRLDSDRSIGFDLPTDYDKSRPLIIDPVLTFCSFFGGSGLDRANWLARNAAGDLYLVGLTYSADFPSGPSPQRGGLATDCDAFLTKVGYDGTLAWTTFLGGAGPEAGRGVCVDANGTIFMTGSASAGSQGLDVLVAKFDENGKKLFAVTFGSDLDDEGLAIAVDGVSRVFVTGYTMDAMTFPRTQAYDDDTLDNNQTAFVAELNSSGTQILYSIFPFPYNREGDIGLGIAVDPVGNACATGGGVENDSSIGQAYLVRLNSSGGIMPGNRVFGGSPHGSPGSFARGIALDPYGDAYIVGQTSSLDFPVNQAFQPAFGGGLPGPNFCDAFIIEISPSGGILYSTYLGGSGDDSGIGISFKGHTVIVCGITSSVNFPLAHPVQGAYSGATGYGGGDAFIAKLTLPDNTFHYGTYLGGCGDDVAYNVVNGDSSDCWVAGFTNSLTFPTVNGPQDQCAGDYDAFLARLSPPDEHGDSIIIGCNLGAIGLIDSVRIEAPSAGTSVVRPNVVPPVPFGSAVRLYGRILDTAYSPVRSAKVEVFDGIAYDYASRINGLDTVLTDSAGRFAYQVAALPTEPHTGDYFPLWFSSGNARIAILIPYEGLCMSVDCLTDSLSRVMSQLVNPPESTLVGIITDPAIAKQYPNYPPVPDSMTSSSNDGFLAAFTQFYSGITDRPFLVGSDSSWVERGLKNIKQSSDSTASIMHRFLASKIPPQGVFFIREKGRWRQLTSAEIAVWDWVKKVNWVGVGIGAATCGIGLASGAAPLCWGFVTTVVSEVVKQTLVPMACQSVFQSSNPQTCQEVGDIAVDGLSVVAGGLIGAGDPSIARMDTYLNMSKDPLKIAKWGASIVAAASGDIDAAVLSWDLSQATGDYYIDDDLFYNSPLKEVNSLKVSALVSDSVRVSAVAIQHAIPTGRAAGGLQGIPFRVAATTVHGTNFGITGAYDNNSNPTAITLTASAHRTIATPGTTTPCSPKLTINGGTTSKSFDWQVNNNQSMTYSVTLPITQLPDYQSGQPYRATVRVEGYDIFTNESSQSEGSGFGLLAPSGLNLLSPDSIGVSFPSGAVSNSTGITLTTQAVSQCQGCLSKSLLTSSNQFLSVNALIVLPDTLTLAGAATVYLPLDTGLVERYLSAGYVFAVERKSGSDTLWTRLPSSFDTVHFRISATTNKLGMFAAVVMDTSCCIGKSGNVNGVGVVDLADLSAMVSYLTGGGYVLPCKDEADINGSGVVDLGDLSALVSYLTGGGFVLPNCP